MKDVSAGVSTCTLPGFFLFFSLSASPLHLLVTNACWLEQVWLAKRGKIVKEQVKYIERVSTYNLCWRIVTQERGIYVLSGCLEAL